MFKKEPDDNAIAANPRSPQTASSRQQKAPRGGGSAVIGQSITVKGDVSGDEDLLIQGSVHGTVKLSQHNVTIGATGKVKADVHGRMVIVEGEVDGDLKAQEQIILRHTARVEGSISAPRVALEDGAVFRGGIEMDSGSTKGGEPKPTGVDSPNQKDRSQDRGPKTPSTTNATGKSLSN